VKSKGIVFLIILSLIQSTPVGYAAEIVTHSDTIEGSSLSFRQLVPYPEFSSQPNITNTGTSSQFSYEYENNEVRLIWSHEAGTRLDFREQPDENLPDCKEFIYLSQDMHWPIDNFPLERKLTVNFQVIFNGSFNEEIAGPRMFTVYMWFIDSSGNWVKVYESFPPYVTQGGREIILSNFEVEDIWEGMIADEEGNQENPTDVFELAIGIAPSLNMESDLYGNPWEFYNGSVTVSVQGISLEVLLDSGGNPQARTPSYFGNITFGYYTLCEDMTFDSIGNVYTVGTIMDYTDRVYCLVLTKWDSNAQIQWTKLWNGTPYAQGHGIATNENNIYTVGSVFNESGNLDFSIVKWDTNGNVNWEKTWDGEESWLDLEPYLENRLGPDYEILNHSFSDDRGLAIEINDNGDLLSLVKSSFNMDLYNEESDAIHSYSADILTLLIHSQDGNLLQTEIIDMNSWIWDEYVDIQISDNYIYTIGSNITKLDKEYNIEWSTLGWGDFIVRKDDVFCNSAGYDSWEIYEFLLDPSFPYFNNFSWFWHGILDLGDSPWLPSYYNGPSTYLSDNSIISMMELSYYYPDIYQTGDSNSYSLSELYLVKLNASHQIEWLDRIELDYWPSATLDQGNGILKYRESTGQILFAGTSYAGISLYIFNDRSVAPPGYDFGIVIYGVSAALIGLVAVDYLRRRRNASSSEI